MFAILIKESYLNLRLHTMKGKFRMLHCSSPHMKHKPPSKHCKKEHEEEDEEYEEDCEEEPKSKAACPKDHCRPPPTEAPCLPPPPRPRAVGKSSFLGAIGPNQISVLIAYIPGLLRYGVVALVGLCYATEFKTVLQYLPFYNGKYESDSDVKKPKEPQKDDELVEAVQENTGK